MPVRIRLNWTDNNLGEVGHKVYRSTSPMDPGSLPAPLATLAANVTEYVDEAVTEGLTYYYRVSSYNSYKEKVSSEVSELASLTVRPQPFAIATTASDSASVALNLPTGWAAGDLAVMLMTSNQGTVNPLPSGWTLVGSLVTQGSTRRRVAWRILQSGDSFTIPSSGQTSALIIGFKSGTFNSTTPVQEKSANVGSSSKPVVPSYSAVPAGSYIAVALASGINSAGVFPITSPYANYPQPPMSGVSNRAIGAGISNFTWSMCSLVDFDGGSLSSATFNTNNVLTSWSSVGIIVKGFGS